MPRLDGDELRVDRTATSPVDLDDPCAIARVDAADFLGCVERFPAQVEAAWDYAQSLRRFPSGRDIRSIAVLGMGGSAMAGDVVRAVAAEAGSRFVQTVRGYELPAYIGPSTLVFAVSYSGNTEETLDLFRQAVERRARLVAVSSGGALAEEASTLGIPLVVVPEGMQPRAALGWLALPIIEVCERLGILTGVGCHVPAVVERLKWTAEACNRTSPTMLNPAKQLALHLLGKQVWIYGGEGLPEIAAYRWKCQLNECAEAVASWHCFPELTHNEIVGWQVDTGSSASRALLVLRDERERPQFARRIDTTVELVERRFAFVEQVTTRGSSPLLRLLDLCYLGDFVSTYLGIAGGIDPNAIELIDRLKDAAARQRAELLPSTAPSSRGLVLGP